uniref:Uncharacterized protein LOC114328979 n=1 Tax=Diabrotica virgifera virgifera TaxID=50390 RepID=A0A6P7FLD6_DIAVI
MPGLPEQIYCAEQITIPPSFPYLLRQYAKAAIRSQPNDLLQWSTAYFRCLSLNIPPPVKPRLEYPIPRDHYGITPGWLKALLYQLTNNKTIHFKILWDRWIGACLPHYTLIQILCLGGFDNPKEIPWLRFIGLCAAHLTDRPYEAKRPRGRHQMRWSDDIKRVAGPMWKRLTEIQLPSYLEGVSKEEPGEGDDTLAPEVLYAQRMYEMEAEEEEYQDESLYAAIADKDMELPEEEEPAVRESIDTVIEEPRKIVPDLEGDLEDEKILLEDLERLKSIQQEIPGEEDEEIEKFKCRLIAEMPLTDSQQVAIEQFKKKEEEEEVVEEVVAEEEKSEEEKEEKVDVIMFFISLV